MLYSLSYKFLYFCLLGLDSLSLLHTFSTSTTSHQITTLWFSCWEEPLTTRPQTRTFSIDFWPHTSTLFCHIPPILYLPILALGYWLRLHFCAKSPVTWALRSHNVLSTIFHLMLIPILVPILYPTIPPPSLSPPHSGSLTLQSSTPHSVYFCFYFLIFQRACWRSLRKPSVLWWPAEYWYVLWPPYRNPLQFSTESPSYTKLRIDLFM